MTKILVVEDKTDLLNLYADLLIRQGYEVTKASDGQQALEVLAKEVFDLVLLDVMMPELDGLQVLDKIAENSQIYAQPLNKIMILTNFNQDQIIEKSIAYGTRGYLVKSDYNPAQFLEVIKNTLEENTKTEEN